MDKLEKSASAVSQAAREKCRGLPRIPWVAKWFTAGQAALKLLQLLSCSVAVILMFSWGKDPSSALSFNNLVFEDSRGTLDFRPQWCFFAAVGLFTCAYALLLPAAGFVGLNVWPLTRTVLSIFCTLLWLVGGPVMSAAITLMEVSRYANENLVDFLMPKIAIGAGFVSLGLCVMDVLLALTALREHHTSDQFIKEVASMSTLTHTSVVTGQPPSVTGQPPSATGQPPSATGQPPSATGQPPSAPSPPPAAGIQPLSATDQPPSAPSPPPAAGIQPPSATDQHTSPHLEKYLSAHSFTALKSEEGTTGQPSQDTLCPEPTSPTPKEETCL